MRVRPRKQSSRAHAHFSLEPVARRRAARALAVAFPGILADDLERHQRLEVPPYRMDARLRLSREIGRGRVLHLAERPQDPKSSRIRYHLQPPDESLLPRALNKHETDGIQVGFVMSNHADISGHIGHDSASHSCDKR